MNPQHDVSALQWRLLQPGDLVAMYELHLLSIAGMATPAVKPESREFLHGLLHGRGRVIGAWHGAVLVAYGVLQHDLLPHDDPRSMLGLNTVHTLYKFAGAAVRPQWRGLGLQRSLIRRRMALAAELVGMAADGVALFSTAAPCNLPSWHNLLACGFCVRALQYRYGDHARYLLVYLPNEAGGARAPGGCDLNIEELPRQQALLEQGWRGTAPGAAHGSLHLVPPAEVAP